VQGLAAITANNGWAMAAAGACIVIAGLSLLSFIISQLHKVIIFFEKEEKPAQTPPAETAPAPSAQLKDEGIDALSDLQATAKLIRPFAVELGNSFKLAELYKTLDKANFPHPHITVRELKSAGYLTPSEEGRFSWNNI
jgi:Na+-transporting methylmalonyl-CoA/oxaloacetate decarboxylase gamma subunit